MVVFVLHHLSCVVLVCLQLLRLMVALLHRISAPSLDHAHSSCIDYGLILRQSGLTAIIDPIHNVLLRFETTSR